MSTGSVLPITSPRAAQRFELGSSVAWMGRCLEKGYKDLTSSKTQIFVAQALSGLAVAAATVVGGLAIVSILAMPTGWWTAIPLCLFGGLSFIYSFQITDYDNPRVIEGFRREAETLSLDAIVLKHGWEKMITYGIPTQARFNVLYREKAQALPLKELISFYETVVAETSREVPFRPFIYAIPHPREWRAKWRAETASMTCCDMVDSYSLASLDRYQILSQEELQALCVLNQRRIDALVEHRQALTGISDEYHRIIAPHLHILQVAHTMAEREFRGNWGPERLQRITTEYRQDVERIKAEKDARIAGFQRQFRLLEQNFQRKPKAEKTPQAREELERQRKESVYKVKQAEESTVISMRIAQQNATEKRRAFSVEIRQAEERKRLFFRTAQEKFTRDTSIPRETRDRKLQEEEGVYMRNKEVINTDYRTFLEIGSLPN